jgi:hypothetical protein
VAAHLKYEGHSNYSNEQVVFAHSTEHIHFIWLASIELVEYLHLTTLAANSLFQIEKLQI